MDSKAAERTAWGSPLHCSIWLAVVLRSITKIRFESKQIKWNSYHSLTAQSPSQVFMGWPDPRVGFIRKVKNLSQNTSVPRDNGQRRQCLVFFFDDLRICRGWEKKYIMKFPQSSKIVSCSSRITLIWSMLPVAVDIFMNQFVLYLQLRSAGCLHPLVVFSKLPLLP